jgi:hypothetical protein
LRDFICTVQRHSAPGERELLVPLGLDRPPPAPRLHWCCVCTGEGQHDGPWCPILWSRGLLSLSSGGERSAGLLLLHPSLRTTDHTCELSSPPQACWALSDLAPLFRILETVTCGYPVTPRPRKGSPLPVVFLNFFCSTGV